MTPWPCTACGASGARNIGAKGYCVTHLAELFGTFDPAVFTNRGVGVPSGAARPDLGPSIADLRCNSCGATWAGLAGEPCWWCERSRQRMLEHQAELVLTAPDVDPDDALHDDVMGAWTGRLRVAIEAGIIEERDAERVLRREGLRAA